MSGRIDFGGIERQLGEIVRKLDRPFQDMDEHKRHGENIKKQNELLKEQISLVKWTRILAIFTIIMAIGTIYMAYVQTPMPKLLLNVQESAAIGCVNNTALPYGPEVKVANVGTRSSFDTKLIVTYDKPISFHEAVFVKFSKTVNRTNPNIDTGWVYPLEATIIGYPYWMVDNQKTTILLNEIEPGENLDLLFRFNGQCGVTKDVSFKVTEEGYRISSDVKTSKITWD